MIPLERVREAAERARPHVVRTPMLPAEGALLKLECLQPTGSYKVRGIFSAALNLAPERLRRGLITASAGNTALAVAYVARKLGAPCRVVMFDTTPPTKIAGVERWGGRPVLLKRADLFAWMEAGHLEEPEHFLHPWIDEDIAAGHGGLGLELLEDVPDLARVVIPVGGGGLGTGVASALKGARPEVEVIGVQSDGYPLWIKAFAAGGRVEIAPATIADGTTANFTEVMFERLHWAIDRWLTVPEPRLRAAVAELAATAKIVAEGAGALAFAALEQLPPARGTTVAVVTGGNIEPRLLADLLTA